MDDNFRDDINNKENKEENKLSIEFFSEGDEFLEGNEDNTGDNSETESESTEEISEKESTEGKDNIEEKEEIDVLGDEAKDYLVPADEVIFEKEEECTEDDTDTYIFDESAEEIEAEDIKNKKLRNVIIIVCIIVAAIILAKYFKESKNTDYSDSSGIYATIIEREDAISTKYDVYKSITTESAAKTYFRVDGESFFYCTRDGIKYYSDIDSLEWTDIYTLTSPNIIYEEGIIAITETSSKTIRVYNTDGYAYSVNTEGSIVQASLSEGGYLALILKNEEGYSVQVYDSSGKLIEERVDKMSGIYPVAADISDDNRILAVSYIDTNDIYVKSNLMFLYIDAKEGEGYMDSVYKSIEYEEEIIPWISFMKDNNLFGVSDSSMFVISESGTEEWKMDIQNEITSVYRCDKKRVIVAYGDELINKKGKASGTISWYNINGKEEGSYEFGNKITYLNANKEGIVAGSGNVYRGISYSGKNVWQIVASQTVDDVSMMDKINKVLFVTRGKAEVLKMR